MIRNNDKQHLITIVCSLTKSIMQAKLYGKLDTTKTYILNTIYKLLTKCTDSLSEDDVNKLSLLYNNIFYKSNSICKTYDINSSLNKSTTTHKQNSLIHSNTIPLHNYIEYWQENSVINEIEDIIPEIPVRVKQQSSYESFSNGKIITYSNIGRLCFLLNNETSVNYSIIGELNSNVTSLFDIQYLSESNAVIIVSKNIYSHGDIYIKIIKN